MHHYQGRIRVAAWGAASILAVALPAVCPAQTLQTYLIATIGGTGAAGYSGDGGQATAAQFSSPCAAVLDSSGNLYVSDSANNRIRKITSDGTVSTIAGSGTAGYAGDGKSATDAETQLNDPCGLALDSSGNLYIADTGNHVIRKITGGTISTVAGDNQQGFSGDGFTATSAQLYRPVGVAVDSKGQIYIADAANDRVRLVDTDGNISTVAGDGSASRSGDGGLATSASLNYPTAIALDEATGSYYIADTNNGVIRKVTSDGYIQTVAGTAVNGFNGNGPALQTELFYPKGIVRDSAGYLYFADSVSSRIRVLTPDGYVGTIAGNGGFGNSGDGGPALSAALNFPSSVAVDSNGRVFFVDSDNHTIRRLTPDPTAITERPSINPGGVISAGAFGALSYASAGSWIEIYGTNLAQSVRTWKNSDFIGVRAPLVLDGVRVTIAGQTAFLSYVSPGQVNALIPSNTPIGVQTLTVTTANGISDPYNITINATAPGVLAPVDFKVNGTQYAGALFDDGVYVAPVGAISGYTTRPAKAGDTIVIYGIGFGPVVPYVGFGEIAQQAAQVSTAVDVTIGGVPAQIYYAGVSPQSVGLYQLNVIVPDVTPGDAVPVTVSQGALAPAQTLYIAVQ